jgi:hypothetical protein
MIRHLHAQHATQKTVGPTLIASKLGRSKFLNPHRGYPTEHELCRAPALDCRWIQNVYNKTWWEERVEAVRWLSRQFGGSLCLRRKEVCQDFCVNGLVLFLGMGSGDGGNSPPPAPNYGKYKLQVLYLVSLREQRTSFSLAQLYRSCTEQSEFADSIAVSLESKEASICLSPCCQNGLTVITIVITSEVSCGQTQGPQIRELARSCPAERGHRSSAHPGR